MTISDPRLELQNLLSTAYPGGSYNEFGNFTIQFPENPVVCKVVDPEGRCLLHVESPVLLDIPAPDPQVYELICLLQKSIAIGGLITVGGSSGDIHLLVRAALPHRGLSAELLVEVVEGVRKSALAEIERFRGLTPAVGGFTAYGVTGQ